MWSKAGPGTDVVADVDALLASRPWGTSNPRARLIYTANRVDRPTGRKRLHDLKRHGVTLPTFPHLPPSQQVGDSPY